MNAIKTLIPIVVLAILYSCGNNKNTNGQKTDSLEVAKIEQVNKEKLANTSSKVDLYKYFSKEEMQKEMDKSMSVFHNVDLHKKSDFVRMSAYEKLFKEEGFGISPDELEKKWGKAKKREVVIPEKEEGEDDVYSTPYAILEFEPFIINLDSYEKNTWLISFFKTETVGFGFAGVFVGVPKCNKEYLLKLFEKMNAETRKDGEEEWLYIVLQKDPNIHLSINLDKNKIVKSVAYEAQTYAD